MAFDSTAPSTAQQSRADGRPTPIDEAVEREFNLRPRHPERQSVYAGFGERSAAFRAATPGALLDRRYGDGPRALLDVFPAGAGAPVLLFIHGGYWRTLDKELFSFLAAPYVAAGVTVVMPNYDLAPSVPLARIAEQMHQALAWLRAAAPSFGADAARIVLSGHSAGGHLAALTTLAGGAAGEPGGGGDIRGIVPVSGLFDLVPLLRTSINRDARLSPADADALSPLRLARRLPALPAVPLRLLVGGGETAGFQQQSRDFLEVWRSRGGSGELLLAPGRTHFTVLESLADPAGPVFKDILGFLEAPSSHRGA